MATQSRLNAQPGNIVKCAENVCDDLEFIAEANFGVEIIECIPGQWRAAQ